MAPKTYVVHAEWDEEAKVWVATSEDVPGLVAEAETVEALDARLRTLIPELLELNGVLPGNGTGPAEVPVSLIAKRLERIRLRA